MKRLDAIKTLRSSNTPRSGHKLNAGILAISAALGSAALSTAGCAAENAEKNNSTNLASSDYQQKEFDPKKDCEIVNSNVDAEGSAIGDDAFAMSRITAIVELNCREIGQVEGDAKCETPVNKIVHKGAKKGLVYDYCRDGWDITVRAPQGSVHLKWFDKK